MGAEALFGAQVLGSVMGAGGAYSSAAGAKAGYKAQAAIARNNVKYMEWEAQDALARGQRAEQRVRANTTALKSRQQAMFAARGLDMGYGSALSILTDTDFIGEMDAMTERSNAAREAWAKREQARGALADASNLRQAASEISPFRSAMTSLITSAPAVASSWSGTKWAGTGSKTTSWNPYSPIGNDRW